MITTHPVTQGDKGRHAGTAMSLWAVTSWQTRPCGPESTGRKVVGLQRARGSPEGWGGATMERAEDPVKGHDSEEEQRWVSLAPVLAADVPSSQRRSQRTVSWDGGYLGHEEL